MPSLELDGPPRNRGVGGRASGRVAGSVARLGFAAAIALVLSGCGQNWFANRKSNPVIQENIGLRAAKGSLTTISTTASHRTAYMRLAGGRPVAAAPPQGDQSGWVGKAGQLCPEPPPDVAQAVADSLGGALTTQGAGIAVQQAFATSVAPLIRRSQGLQYHRDQVFFLCVAYMNDLVDDRQFLEEWRRIQDRSAEIIKLEVRETSVSTVTLPGEIKATVPTTDLPALVASLGTSQRRPQRTNASDSAAKDSPKPPVTTATPAQAGSPATQAASPQH